MTKLQRDVEEALENGARKIEQLRGANELLAIKAQAFDAMAGLIKLLVPRESQGYEPDAVYLMRKALEAYRLDNIEAASKEESGTAGVMAS